MHTLTCDICDTEYPSNYKMAVLRLPGPWIDESKSVRLDICSVDCLIKAANALVLDAINELEIEDEPEPEQDPDVEPGEVQISEVQIGVAPPKPQKFRPLTEEEASALTGVEKRGLRG